MTRGEPATSAKDVPPVFLYDLAPIKALITAAYWTITTLDTVLSPLVGPASAALAIVLLTLAVRLLLIPVGRSQVKATVTRRRLAPKISELQRRHRKEPEVLQRKMLELYTDQKASPLAGCLPALAQMPVLMAVYGLFIQPTINGGLNHLLDSSFLGIPLDTGFLGLLGSGGLTWQSAVVFIAIMIVIAAVAQASRKLLASASAPTPAESRTPGTPDPAAMAHVLSFLPFVTALFAAVVPLAAAIYLMTTVVWTFGERLVLGRIYGLIGPGRA